jgi:alcohol dehydrogenase class IV
MKFTHYRPTKIFFGSGGFQQAAELVTSLGKRVLLVTGRKAMKTLGYTGRLQTDLQGLGAVTSVYDNISASPLSREINEGVERFREWKPQVIAALGGGSVIDAAKAIDLGLTTGEKIEPYLLGERSISTVGIPLVAIPTTAGTGSEVNPISLLTDQALEIKKSMRHEGLFPAIAIVDPALTLSLNREITLDTGFDVFTHAVETYVSRAVKNPLVDMYSQEAIRMVKEYLPRVLENGQDLEARSRMSYASMIMGINLANSSACLPHRLQYGVGIKTGTSHGAGLRALYRSWLDKAYEYAAEKFNRVGQILSGRRCENKSDFMSAYDSFIDSIGAHLTLADLKITEDDLPWLVGKVVGGLNNDPAGEAPDIVNRIYRDAL